MRVPKKGSHVPRTCNNETGVKPDPKKVEAVLNFPRSKNTKNIKQFLGLAGYYRRFLNNFSKTARPLTALLKKDEPFVWQEPQETAFVTLRNQLCTEPLLQHPDFTQPFVLTTDASGYAIGSILSQGDVGKDKPIAYASRLLNKAEQNYSTIEKESLAIVYCVNHFQPYLYGNKFTIVTDHKLLEWLHSVKNPTSRLVRWRLKLAEYEYNIMYWVVRKVISFFPNRGRNCFFSHPTSHLSRIIIIYFDSRYNKACLRKSSIDSTQ